MVSKRIHDLNGRKMLLLCLLIILTFGKAQTPAATAIDDWNRLSDMPTPRWAFTAAAVDGKIYTISGFASGRNSNSMEVYDIFSDSWTSPVDIPTARRDHAAVVVNGKIFVIGGDYRDRMGKVEEYDPITDTWRRREDMPTPRSDLAAVVVNNRIYAIGGWGGENKVEEFDPVTNKWRTRAPMPTPRYSLAAVAVAGRIYAIGGMNEPEDKSCHLATVEEYNPATDTWTSKVDMPLARSNFAAGVVEGRIFVMGGSMSCSSERCSTCSTVVDTVVEYNPAADQWTSRRKMPNPRQDFAAVSIGGRIYVLGGEKHGDAIALVEEYVPFPIDTDGDGIEDFAERMWYKTNPEVPDTDKDTDGDGLTNVDEVDRYFTDPLVPDADSDTDGDGLLNIDEGDRFGTNPAMADTDADGLSDAEEMIVYFTNPLFPDADIDWDGDGLSNVGEVDIYGTNPLIGDTDEDDLIDGEEWRIFETDPLNNDTDADGLPDGFEITYQLNPLSVSDAEEDPDSDGLPNIAEYQLSTNPKDADTDSDGLLDGEEVNVYMTNPLAADSDRDKITDGEEIDAGTDPNDWEDPPRVITVTVEQPPSEVPGFGSVELLTALGCLAMIIRKRIKQRIIKTVEGTI